MANERTYFIPELTLLSKILTQITPNSISNTKIYERSQFPEIYTSPYITKINQDVTIQPVNELKTERLRTYIMLVVSLVFPIYFCIKDFIL